MVVCADCGLDRTRASFSKRQLRLPAPRCSDCVQGPVGSFVCTECGQSFRDQNSLEQHQHKHRERNFPCPGCGKRYRGMTDAAMHFESGSCEACRGQDNARRAAHQLVLSQPGGRNFLASRPLMLDYNGQGSGDNYEYTGNQDYECAACHRRFSLLSSLMQHQQNRPQCLAGGQHVNARLGFSAPAAQRMRFYHGTTWATAKQIERDGFLPSESGCLGRGIYVAREDKARRFAQQRAREQAYADCGGLVELLVTVRNPKYVLSNDYHWQSEGYDACRSERTTASTNMEWCIRDAGAIEVVGVEAVYI